MLIPAARIEPNKNQWLTLYALRNLSLPVVVTGAFLHPVYEHLCRKYHTTPKRLREKLYSAKFGVEVRNPALGGPSSEMLFDVLLDILEEQTEGIRTELG